MEPADICVSGRSIECRGLSVPQGGHPQIGGDRARVSRCRVGGSAIAATGGSRSERTWIGSDHTFRRARLCRGVGKHIHRSALRGLRRRTSRRQAQSVSQTRSHSGRSFACAMRVATARSRGGRDQRPSRARVSQCDRSWWRRRSGLITAGSQVALHVLRVDAAAVVKSERPGGLQSQSRAGKSRILPWAKPMSILPSCGGLRLT